MRNLARVMISIGRPIATATLLFVAIGLATVASPMRSLIPAAFAADPQSVDFTVNGATSDQALFGQAPLSVDFAGTATGEPTSWAWSFGDGSSGEGRTAAHTYEAPGTYTLVLTATFSDGSQASLTRADLITVTDPRPEPVAAFTVTGTTFIAGRSVAFVNTSAGDPKHFTWIFGDGTTSIETDPTHTYASAGTFTVTLTARTGAMSSTATRAMFVIPAWTGSMNLYRSGVFSTQATYTWCVPTSSQIMVNIINHRSVHSSTEQYNWYRLGRRLNRYRYSYPGVDPQGFAGILNTVGVGPYRVYAGNGYQTTLRYAARRMRLTGKPVGLFVSAGRHAWVLNGFRSTADPAMTSSYTVTDVYVMGPLWPKQTRGYYDMAPNKRLSNATFGRILTRYDDRIRTIWDYHYVIVAP
jgi:PKD repeat protein